jgi:hypothetical protein
VSPASYFQISRFLLYFGLDPEWLYFPVLSPGSDLTHFLPLAHILESLPSFHHQFGTNYFNPADKDSMLLRNARLILHYMLQKHRRLQYRQSS